MTPAERKERIINIRANNSQRTSNHHLYPTVGEIDFLLSEIDQRDEALRAGEALIQAYGWRRNPHMSSYDNGETFVACGGQCAACKFVEALDKTLGEE